ncbi:TonB-dependent receptor [Sphingomonas sp. BK580]|uniref:TonB-dependent receptor n=1 Tax=Sphingomonas sp. BK580 TaxID=2586972 RepID=UPI001607291D|nr:TonB-dependent receptor [Sphingomonas sp. BK580]MBB3694391.1 iron complex outermembrane receptor protein [Sphingomonas sp. BK580]
MYTSFARPARCLLALSGAVLLVTPAQAQGPAQSPKPGTVTEGKDGEVIVTTTAQKRFENIQDVPLAVQVVTPAQLEAQGVHHFQDLERVMPSLVIRPADHPVNTNVSMRGVGTFAYAIGVESSVAVTVDGAPVAFLARAINDLPDVAMIEALRGPQSTLYGKAASAGLIKIMTTQPTNELHIRANARLTADHEFAEQLSLTGPLTDTLGYVVTGGYTYWDGNVRNRFDGRRLGGRDTFTTRGKLRWRPRPELTFTLSGNYIDGSTAAARPFVRLAPTARLHNEPDLTAAVVLPGVTAGPGNQTVAYNARSGTDYHGSGALLRSEIDLGAVSLLGLTNYDRFKLYDYLDFDDTAARPRRGNVREVGAFDSRLFTQEVRLLSRDDAAFRYALGLYYADTGFDRPFQRGPAFALSHLHATAGSRQLAGFGQIDWQVVPKLTATAGGRVQNERVRYTFADLLAAERHPEATSRFAGHDSDDAATYRLGLSYQAARDLMAFASYATGYKGQAYDLSTGFDQKRADGGPIRPERSRDEEVGIRSQWLERHLTLNTTFFDTQYRDLQAQTVEFFPDGSYLNRLTNVGKLVTRGVEVEASARPSGAVTLSANATYLNARYLSFPAAPCFPLQTAAQGCVGTPRRQDLAGERLAQAPTWRFDASGEYAPALGHDRRGVIQAAWRYQGAMSYAPRDPQLFQRAYHVADVSLGLRDETRHWEGAVFLDNVFDQRHYASLVNVANNFGNQTATAALLPRDFRRYGGVRIGLSF